MLVCEKVIPIVHRLEQVSSGEHVGSLAENLLEALRSQPQCAAKVQEARDFTRQVSVLFKYVLKDSGLCPGFVKGHNNKYLMGYFLLI